MANIPRRTCGGSDGRPAAIGREPIARPAVSAWTSLQAVVHAAKNAAVAISPTPPARRHGDEPRDLLRAHADRHGRSAYSCNVVESRGPGFGDLHLCVRRVIAVRGGRWPPRLLLLCRGGQPGAPR